MFIEQVRPYNYPLHLTAGVGPAEAFGLRLARRR